MPELHEPVAFFTLLAASRKHLDAIRPGKAAHPQARRPIIRANKNNGWKQLTA